MFPTKPTSVIAQNVILCRKTNTLEIVGRCDMGLQLEKKSSHA